MAKIVAGLPTKTRTFGGKRYKLYVCSCLKRAAETEKAHWHRKGYSVRVVVFNGVGALPLMKHYCLYYRWPK